MPHASAKAFVGRVPETSAHTASRLDLSVHSSYIDTAWDLRYCSTLAVSNTAVRKTDPCELVEALGHCEKVAQGHVL